MVASHFPLFSAFSALSAVETVLVSPRWRPVPPHRSPAPLAHAPIYRAPFPTRAASAVGRFLRSLLVSCFSAPVLVKIVHYVSCVPEVDAPFAVRHKSREGGMCLCEHC